MNDDNSNDNETGEQLHTKLNRETSRMAWKELLRHFASGTVIAVSKDLDLIKVAASVANDDAEAVAQWMAEQRFGRVTDAQALAWLEADAQLWAVVVKPWILVQQDAAAQGSAETLH